MVALAVTLSLGPSSTLHQVMPISCRSFCCLTPSTHLFCRPLVCGVRFSVSSVLSSPSIVDQSAKFVEVSKRGNLIPLHQCIFSDHLTPVLAYRCLVNENDHETPSFLLESVEPGLHTSSVGRYSILGANPAMEVMAKENLVTMTDHQEGWRTEEILENPMVVPRRITERWSPQRIDELPQVFCGGWFGYFSYDTVRYADRRLPFASAPVNDRNLPDVHLALYDDVLVFDHVEKKVYVIHWVQLDRYSSTEEAFSHGMNRLESLLSRVNDIVNPRLSAGSVELDTQIENPKLEVSGINTEALKKAILKAKKRIFAGDVSQVVLSQHFERRTFMDPFEVYRALRIVNPSPFMAYIQVRGCVLVASSPEMLTRVEQKGNITSRSLLGANRRGKTPKEDHLLGAQLLNGQKQYKEHMMLTDSANKGVVKVLELAPVNVERLLNFGMYSDVKHISSVAETASLELLTCWDTLTAALPLGEVTGSPKIRAMELIDELEVNRRGPYGGAFGCISVSGDMDITPASRTILFPTGKGKRQQWVAHLQAGATIMADSDPRDVVKKCKSEATELARAIDLAESSFE